MATPNQAVVLARELTAAGADWQFHWFGHTLHAFTNPRANDRAFGTVYDETASRRAWQGLQAFLTEVLQFRT
jgi:dienelactone hydrolase